MASTVDQAFVKQYEADVKLAYQQMGSKLRGTVRTKAGVKGASLRFQKVGKGTASSKTRAGDIPLMEAVHSYIDITLADYYAGDYIDHLDEYKTNIDEKKVILDTSAGAIGRKMDELIITAAALTSSSKGTGAALEVGATASANAFKLIKQAITVLNKNDVPDDGQRFVLVTPEVWDLLLDEDKFSRAAYVGEDLPFLKGTEARKYMNCNIMVHTGLTVTNAVGATQYSTCLAYHKTAIGLGEAEFIESDIWWDGRKASHFIHNRMSGNAGLIDVLGCVKILVNNGL